MTMVSAMPASLCSCSAWKSGRCCISMNARRLGYLTMPTRSHFGESLRNWVSTSPTNTGSAPMAANGPSGAYSSSA